MIELRCLGNTPGRYFYQSASAPPRDAEGFEMTSVFKVSSQQTLRLPVCRLKEVGFKVNSHQTATSSIFVLCIAFFDTQHLHNWVKTSSTSFLTKWPSHIYSSLSDISSHHQCYHGNTSRFYVKPDGPKKKKSAPLLSGVRSLRTSAARRGWSTRTRPEVPLSVRLCPPALRSKAALNGRAHGGFLSPSECHWATAGGPEWWSVLVSPSPHSVIIIGPHLITGSNVLQEQRSAHRLEGHNLRRHIRHLKRWVRRKGKERIRIETGLRKAEEAQRDMVEETWLRRWLSLLSRFT